MGNGAQRTRRPLGAEAGGGHRAATSPARPKRDPVFGAAVLNLTFQLRKDEQSPQFKSIYEGVLRDLKITDEVVEAFLVAHRPAVEEAIRSHGRGESE